MKIRHLYFLLTVLAVSGLFSCKSSYQKLLKSSDYDLKQRKAKEYYNKGQYVKAIPLFEELIGILKGTQDVEDYYYFYPYCYYGQGDYQFASYYFKNFVEYYPRSPRAEDARFMAAYCNYKLSPVVELDQEYTGKAIESFQLFANAYPESELIPEVNEIMDKMRVKLERKAHRAARLYFDMKDYLSAATALNNLLLEYPETESKEEVQFLIMKSYFLYAENSIREKQEERYNLFVNGYTDFIEKYPESKKLNEAEQDYKDAIEKLDELKLSEKPKKKLLKLPGTGDLNIEN